MNVQSTPPLGGRRRHRRISSGDFSGRGLSPLRGGHGHSLSWGSAHNGGASSSASAGKRCYCCC
jgi:hypothetical protein